MSEKDVRGEALSIDFPRQGEMDEFDAPRQSVGLNGDNDVQSTSQTKFENINYKVNDVSQDNDWLRAEHESSASDGSYANEFYSRNTMVKNVCVPCFQEFANKSNLNRHTKMVHRTHVQSTVDDDPRQMWWDVW